MIPFELTILGTSSALPTIKRYPTAHVLNVGERFFLIDCGEGTQIQLRKYGVKFSRINHIFISHLHGDHYFGLIGLISTYTLLGRKNDLHIYSHSELPEMLKMQLEQLLGDLTFKIIWHPLNFKKSAVILDDEKVTVTSFPLKHRIACCGFLFTEKSGPKNIIKEKIAQYQIPLREIPHIKNGADFIDREGNTIPNGELTLPEKLPRKYAFCTDTLYIPELKETLNGVNLLYHEATYDKRFQEQASQTYHSTAEQAATLALNSNAGQLLIGHFSARYKDTEILIEEAKRVFPATTAAEEGMVIKIS
ncbi:MAG TPA: ribonuclease Z [Prolixibacteraceae bacterium]|nr:ribonuclease Z [Prolixibacteraceae bacterium]HPS13207.1 ribonuclease Z [Prolixibacteraceae bacterium]